MITRILVALVALYIVAGAPKPGDLPGAGLLVGPHAQANLAKQAVDFCLANRETCASAAAHLASAPARTGAIATPPALPAPEQALPLPAPELPLPPRRQKTARHGA